MDQFANAALAAQARQDYRSRRWEGKVLVGGVKPVPVNLPVDVSATDAAASSAPALKNNTP